MTDWGSHKLDVHELSGSVSAETTIWSPSGSLRIVPTHIQATVATGGLLQLFFESNSSGNRLVSIRVGDNGGIVREFEARSGRVGGAGQALKAIHSGGGLVSILVEGFTRS